MICSRFILQLSHRHKAISVQNCDHIPYGKQRYNYTDILYIQLYMCLLKLIDLLSLIDHIFWKISYFDLKSILDFCFGSVFFFWAIRARISFADRFIDRRSPPFACAGAGSLFCTNGSYKTYTHQTLHTWKLVVMETNREEVKKIYSTQPVIKSREKSLLKLLGRLQETFQ